LKKTGDTILIKGSRGMKMEKIISNIYPNLEEKKCFVY